MAERGDAGRGVAASAATPWPASAVFGPRGLELGGVPAAELADRYGTPVLVIDEDEVVGRMRGIAGAFPRAAYAVKALTTHRVLRLALAEGLDLLCATGGEVEACLRAGAPADRIMLHGNAKTDGELEAAVREGVGCVIADGIEELRRLSAIARSADRVQPTLLRVVPDVHVRTHEAIATGHAASKFGTPIAEVPEVVREIATLPGVRLDGFHAHVGSQVMEMTAYGRVLDALVDAAEAAGAWPAILDIGGGFGVATSEIDEAALDVTTLARALTRHLAEEAAERSMPLPQLVAEPGRSIVANAGVTLYRVVAVKRTAGRTIVAVDGGMSDNLRPMLYDARHAVAPAGAVRAGANLRGSVVGRHCESGDTLVDEVLLPAEIRAGDLLALAATGAYTYGLASNYNRIGRLPIVGIAGGVPTTWRRREEAADLDRLEVGAMPFVAHEAPPGVRVRPAAAADAPSYRELWRAVVAEGRWVRAEEATQPLRVYRRRFRRSLTDEGADLVAVDGDVLIGHVAIQRERHPATRHVATLGIAVAASHRGEGVGAALLAAAFEWARRAGVRRIVLSVYPHNAAAIALYRRFGFVEEGRLSRQSRKSYGYQDEILMAVWIGEEDT